MTNPTPSPSASIDSVIRSRRTSMLVEDTDLPADLVQELCELASWAPCHRRTWPWQFAVITGDARTRFGACLADVMAELGDDPAKVAKTRTKYLRTPSVLVVASSPGDSALRTQENRDATAAAIQNLLLAAAARGVATFWSSCPRGCHEAVADFCSFQRDSMIVGIIYLGWASSLAEAPPRPLPSLTVITD